MSAGRSQMQEFFLIREIQIFLACIALALGIAWLTSPRKASNIPAWPTRLYLTVIERSRTPLLSKNYRAGRTVYSRREQFLTTFFIWFFALLLLGMFVFGCGLKGCT